MKNLRDKNPLLKAYHQAVRQPVSHWPELELQARIDLCVQFLLLPAIRKDKSLKASVVEAILPSAVDLERQASALYQEQPALFQQIEDLLEKTTGLFLMITDHE